MVLKAGLKVGQMTKTIWVTWVTFLVGQVGLICKPYYLDVTRIAITCSLQNCWHLVSEWTLGLMNALKYHWCEASLLSQAVLKNVVSQDFIFKSLCQRPKMKKSMALPAPYKLKENLNSTCGSQVDHMWPGSHPHCSVGQWVNRCDRGCDFLERKLYKVADPGY